tara:strand:- start:1528 stop:1671 length:144 start_codon:yes stop_codon:yes gene_type:complete
LNFKEKVVFVTGAAKGTGRATVVALPASGHKVIAADIGSGALKHRIV